jgi:hypothetical protein
VEPGIGPIGLAREVLNPPAADPQEIAVTAAHDEHRAARRHDLLDPLAHPAHEAPVAEPGVRGEGVVQPGGQRRLQLGERLLHPVVLLQHSRVRGLEQAAEREPVLRPEGPGDRLERQRLAGPGARGQDGQPDGVGEQLGDLLRALAQQALDLLAAQPPLEGRQLDGDLGDQGVLSPS